MSKNMKARVEKLEGEVSEIRGAMEGGFRSTVFGVEPIGRGSENTDGVLARLDALEGATESPDGEREQILREKLRQMTLRAEMAECERNNARKAAASWESAAQTEAEWHSRAVEARDEWKARTATEYERGLVDGRQDADLLLNLAKLTAMSTDDLKEVVEAAHRLRVSHDRSISADKEKEH